MLPPTFAMLFLFFSCGPRAASTRTSCRAGVAAGARAGRNARPMLALKESAVGTVWLIIIVVILFGRLSVKGVSVITPLLLPVAFR